MTFDRRSFLKLVAVTGASSAVGGGLSGCALDPPQCFGAETAASPQAVEGGEHLVFDALGRTIELDPSAGVVTVETGESAGAMGMLPNAYPRAAASCPGGRVAVVDASSHSVRVYGADLALLFTVDGVLRAPTGVAFASDGTLLVSDLPAHCVRRFDAAGNDVGSFGSLGSGSAQLNGPRALAIGPDGDVHVVDSGNGRVQVFSAAGDAKGSYGSMGAPCAIAFDRDGRAWVADRVAGNVIVFEDGVSVDSIATSGAPCALSSRPDGNVYVTVG